MANSAGASRFGRKRGGLRRVPLWLVLPAVAFALTFRFAPSVAGGFYAFTNWDGLGATADWIGFDNFRRVFSEGTPRAALVHTLVLAGAFMFLSNLIGLLLALALNRGLKTRNLLRSLFFAPVVMMPLAISYVWHYIYDPDGALNRILGAVGLEQWERPWLGDPSFALWAVLTVLVWQYSGLTMVIFLAGMQGVPDELHEAAAVDGAGAWSRFRNITLPLLAPAITVNATITLILGLRVFDQILALTSGGPVDSTETLATQMWRHTFQYGEFGFGAALALLLAGLIAVLTLSQIAILRARERRL